MDDNWSPISFRYLSTDDRLKGNDNYMKANLIVTANASHSASQGQEPLNYKVDVSTQEASDKKFLVTNASYITNLIAQLEKL